MGTFVKNVKFGVERGYLDKQMQSFDLGLLAKTLDYTRDDIMMYMGTPENPV